MFKPLITSWQFWAFLSATFAALTAIFAKLGVKTVPPDVATFVRTIVILVFVSLLLVSTNQFTLVKTLSPKTVMFLVLSGLATGASWICYFRALNLGKAAQVASIDKLSVVLVAIFAALFLRERLTPQTIVGVSLITAGTIFVALANRRLHVVPKPLALAASTHRGSHFVHLPHRKRYADTERCVDVQCDPTSEGLREPFNDCHPEAEVLAGFRTSVVTTPKTIKSLLGLLFRYLIARVAHSYRKRCFVRFESHIDTSVFVGIADGV